MTASGTTPANLTLNNATFSYLGNNTASVLTADSLGTVAVNSGASFLSSTSGSGVGATAMLTIGTLTRSTGSTLGFLAGGAFGTNQNLNTAFNKILVNALGTGVALVDGILPWATVNTLGATPNQYDFATFVASGGSSSVAAFSNYKTSLASAGPNDIVKLTAGETLASNKVVGAILFAGTTAGANAVITQNNFTLGVTTGAILAMGNQLLTIGGGTAATNGTLDFGSAEGILNQNNANITVNSSITGTGGLTITDTFAGAITLNAANSYTGATTINASVSTLTLTVGNISAFSNGPVNFTSGTLATSVAPPTNSQFGYFTLANPFNFTNSVVTFANSVNRIFLAGPIALTGNNQITANANGFGATGFSGVVSGAGSLNLLGGAIVMQNPNSTYSGGTNLGSGNLIVTASDTVNAGGSTINGPLGTGGLNLGGFGTSGLLQAAATNVPDLTVNAITLHNAITLTNANTIVAGGAGTNAGAGGNITLAGPVTITGANNVVAVTAGFNFTISGNISGTGALTKTNVGALLLSGNNTFTGGVTVTAGAGVTGNVGNLIVGSSNALGTGVLTLNGGTIQDDGVAPRTVTNNVILAAGTNSYINAINKSTPFVFTGYIGGTGSLTKGFADLTTYEATMNDVQTLSFPNSAAITGGTFTLTINGAPTGAIPWSATPATLAANIQTALNGFAITNAAESSTTVTITTSGATGFAVGQYVTISGVAVAGYNGTFALTAASGNTFSYTAASGLSTPSNGGLASALGSIASTYNPVVNGTSLSAMSITFQNISVNADGAATPTVSFNGAGLTLSGAGVFTIAASGSSGAVEAGNTVTITTTAAHNFQVGQYVTITGVGVAGYNGTYYINAVPSATSFQYYDPTSGLTTPSGGGSAAVVSSIAPTLGSGTLTLQGMAFYTGTTTVNAGALSLSGTGQLLNTAGTNQQQTLTFSGVTGGTFTLTLNSQTTGAIQWSGTNATLQANILAALEILPNIGFTNSIPNVAVSNAANPVVTFQNGLAGANAPALIVNPTGLSSGSITVAATTPVSAITVNPGGALTLDNTGTNIVNRLSATEGIALNGGTLNYLGAAGASSTQTLGAITAGPATRRSRPPRGPAAR